jgi:hypothetical protein
LFGQQPNDPESLEKKVSYNNTQERTTGLLFNGSQQQPMGTTTLNEVRSLRGSKHSGVAALNRRTKTKQGGKRRRSWGAISRSPEGY